MDGCILVEQFQEYVGLNTCMPNLVALRRGAVATALESKRDENEEKIAHNDASNIRERASVIVKAVDAECNWLLRQRDQDFRAMMRAYLQQQVDFYATVTQRLQETLSLYSEQ